MAHLRHRQGRRLPRRPGRRRDHVPRRPSTRSSTSRRWACRSTAPPRARSTSAGSAATPATTARPPVRRSCYAADRTGHMILQTLYQNCVKQDVEFFNEFYVLDLLHDRGPRRRRSAPPASSPTSWPPARSTSSRPRRSSSPPAAPARSTRPPPTRTPSPVTAWASPSASGLPLEDMEFFQFHPTGLAGLGILLSEAARGEGGILRNADGERFMERYAPTIKDLAPRDIVARSMANEVREGRGAGPNKDYVLLDLTHLEPAHIDAKLPDITEFARTYLGVEPYTEPVPVYPTAHYAMGGIPTNVEAEVLRNNTDGRPGPVRRRRGRLRVGARLQPAGHQLAARHQRVRPPRRHRRRGVRRRRPDFVELPEHPERHGRRAWSSRIRDRAGRRAGRRPAPRAAGDDGQQRRRCSAPRRSLKQALGVHRRPQGALRQRRRPGQGQALQHRPARGHRARLPARPGRGHRPRRPGPQGVPRRPLPRGLPEPRRRQLHAPHHGLPGTDRRRRRCGVRDEVRLDYKPVTVTRYQPMERKY